MAISAVPFALQNAAHPANLFRQAVSSLVPNAGGVSQPGDLAVTQTGTPSMAVVVGIGRAWVPGTNTANPGGFNYNSQGQYFAFNDANVTLSLANSDPTNPRIDLVCLTINDSFYSGSTNNAVLQVITGTPAASPVAPTAPANSLSLATVSVAANATSVTNSNISQTNLPVGSVYCTNIPLIGMGVATVTGSISLTYISGFKWVDVAVQIQFVSAVSLSTSFTSIGTLLPNAALSSTAPVIYTAGWLNGGSPAFNTACDVFLNPASGAMSLRLQSGTATTNSGVLFSFTTRFQQ